MNEQALKERLKYIADSQNKSFQEVWKSLLLERFLVRLAKSAYTEKLIFKGGLLLSHYVDISRETTDIDFLARKLKSEILVIEKALIDICKTIIDDGFKWSFVSIEELEHSHMNYPGYRAKLKTTFGKMNDRIQLDIGMGDQVDPQQIDWSLYVYKSEPIFEDSITLLAYSPESILSEKLESIVSRGSANSRNLPTNSFFRS